MIWHTTIPAIRYWRAVRDYALAEGLPFFLLRDQRKAMARYNNFQSTNN